MECFQECPLYIRVYFSFLFSFLENAFFVEKFLLPSQKVVQRK